MKIAKVLLVVSIIIVLVCNGYLIYQNNQQKTAVEALQTKVVDLQKKVKSIGSDIYDINYEVQNTSSKVRSVCDSLENCY